MINKQDMTVSTTKAKVRRLLGGELGLVLILTILVVLFLLASPHFLTSRNLMNITRQISINLIVAIGMTLVILSGEIDLSVGSTATLSGVVAAVVLNSTNSVALALLAGLLLGLGIGLVNGLLVVYGRLQSFIVTLATMGILRGLAMVWTNGRPISGLKESFELFGAGYVGPVPVASIISLAIFGIAVVVITRTKHGPYFKAVGANREAALLSAIPVDRYRIAAFAVSGLAAGLGGVIIASRLLSAAPTAAQGMEMDAISAVILGGASLSGGIGTISGTLIGAMILGVIDNGMNLIGVSAFFQQVVKGMIILVAVLAKRDK